MKKIISSNDFYTQIKTLSPTLWSDVYIKFEQNNLTALDYSLEEVQEYNNVIKSLYPNSTNIKFIIDYNVRTNFLFDKDEQKELIKINNYLLTNSSNPLYISRNNTSILFTLKDLIFSTRKLKNVANSIANATITINNQKQQLSNFEKFMLAYEYVSNYKYNKGGDYHYLVNSNWVTTIGKDKIICRGYSSMLKALCDLIFTNNEVKVFEQTLTIYPKDNKDKKERHSNNIVLIKDDKYNIDGMYYADACWDCLIDEKENKAFTFCCVPMQDLLHHKLYNFIFDNGLSNIYFLNSEEYTNNLNKSRNTSIDYNITRLFPPYKNIDEFNNYWIQKYKDYNIENLTFFTQEKNDYLHNFGFEKFKEYKTALKDTLTKYSSIKLPFFFSQCHCLHEEFEKLEKSNDLEKTKETIIKIGEFCLNNPKEIEKILLSARECNIQKTSLPNIIYNFLAYKDETQETNRIKKEKRKLMEINKQENIDNFLNHLYSLCDCKPIPLEAYINSYIAIAKINRIESQQLKAYVRKRTLLSIKSFKENFDTQNCTSSLSKAIYKTVQKETAKMK